MRNIQTKRLETWRPAVIVISRGGRVSRRGKFSRRGRGVVFLRTLKTYVKCA